MYGDIADEDLMPLVVAGNHSAFSEIVERHTDRFYSLAFRSLQNQSDAEDVVQAAFVKLWQRPHAWDGSKSKFTTWFYRVVLNACHDHRRKFKHKVEVDDEELAVLLQATDSEQKNLEQKQSEKWRQDCLEYAIMQLSSSQRDALNLVVYSGLPQKHAAEIMGISIKAIESHLHRAKQSLREQISKLSHEAKLYGMRQSQMMVEGQIKK